MALKLVLVRAFEDDMDRFDREDEQRRGIGQSFKRYFIREYIDNSDGNMWWSGSFNRQPRPNITLARTNNLCEVTNNMLKASLCLMIERAVIWLSLCSGSSV
jgi:hypothetical protein